MATYDFRVLFVTTWMDADDLERRFNELGGQGFAVAAALQILGEQPEHINNAVIFQRAVEAGTP
jgi:hypothetical protein